VGTGETSHRGQWSQLDGKVFQTARSRYSTVTGTTMLPVIVAGSTIQDSTKWIGLSAEVPCALNVSMGCVGTG